MEKHQRYLNKRKTIKSNEHINSTKDLLIPDLKEESQLPAVNVGRSHQNISGISKILSENLNRLESQIGS